MAKKSLKTILEQIEASEQYLRDTLQPAFKADLDVERVNREFDEFVGPWTGRMTPYAGTLGQLYRQRDEIIAAEQQEADDRRQQMLAKQERLEREARERAVFADMSDGEKIAALETEALGVHNAYVRSMRSGDQATSELLGEQLDQVCDQLQPLYAARDLAQAAASFMERVPLKNTAPVATTDVKFLGPEKLSTKAPDRQQRAEKAAKAEDSRAIRAAMKGSTNGGGNNKQQSNKAPKAKKKSRSQKARAAKKQQAA